MSYEDRLLKEEEITWLLILYSEWCSEKSCDQEIFTLPEGEFLFFRLEFSNTKKKVVLRVTDFFFSPELTIV